MKTKIFALTTIFAIALTIAVEFFLKKTSPGIETDAAYSIMLNEKLWSTNLVHNIISTPLVFEENVIVRTTRDIVALNKENGSVVWKAPSIAGKLIPTISIVEFPLVGNSDILAVVERTDVVNVRSPATGTVIWESRIQPSTVDEILLVDHVLLAVIHDFKLVAYKANSGMVLWDVDVPHRTGLNIAANPNYVVLSASNQVKVYDIQSGKLVKEKTYEDLVRDIILDNETLFLTYTYNREWYIASIDLISLENNWTFKSNNANNLNLSISGEYLYAYNNALISIKKDNGEFQWQVTSQGLFSAPATYDDKLYYISLLENSHKNICSLETKSGIEKECISLSSKYTYITPPLYIDGPTIVDSIIIFNNEDTINAFRVKP